MPERPSASKLVVVGASAGGVEALTQLVATLPTPFPAPIVIAQHLDPSHTSHLQPILERTSQIPVRTVTGDTPLQNGVVYVVPANRNVEISDHDVRLSEQEEGRPKPSVNLLFSSAAAAFGEELIAVILTGTGSDGADGARVVKEHGGTVIIQNPQTASHPGMPLSLAPTLVDIVADLPAIGPLLDDILSGTYVAPAPEQNRQVRTLLEQLRQQSGIDFSHYRQSTIQRRLQRRMADTGVSSIDTYMGYVRRHPEEYQRLVATFLIKVTDFFRDTELFAYLRDSLLPELIEHARREGSGLRVWSAGCATGEEAYSLAILVTELLGGEIPAFNVRIFATDLDADAVAFARRGIYPASSLKDLPPSLVETYFNPVDGAYEVKKAIRALLVFGQHDLGQRAPFPRTDLVLCRNVLIYFTPELQRHALQLFAFSLRSGGHLILGKSESTSPLPEHFALEQAHLRIYRREGERILITPAGFDAAYDTPQHAIQARVTELGKERDLVRERQPGRPVRSANERAEITLLNLPAGVVVMDQHYDILNINLAARRLLGIHGTALGEDFVHLARRLPSERLRTIIDAAVHGQTSREIYSIQPPSTGSEQKRHLELCCYPQVYEGDAAGTAVAVMISDVTDRVQQHDQTAAELRGERERLTAELAEQRAESERVSGLIEEARQTVSQLMSANEQLSRSNDLLRVQNEDLLLGTEEAQAAADEVETLNEEQQATNEELETLNEELQATIEELNTTNEDLNARTVELQELAALREAARLRLSAILSSMADAALAVDRNGRLVLANSAFERLFGVDGAGLLAEDEEGQPLPPETTPHQRAARGERFTMQFSTSNADGTRRWFEAVGQPIAEGSSETGIVMIRDITERNLRRLQQQFVAVAAHELRTPITVLEGSLQMLDRRLGAQPTEQLRQYVSMATDEAHRLRTLTEELLDVEQLELGHLRLAREPLDLAEVVRRAASTIQALNEEHAIVVAPFEGALPVSGDRMRLEQVFLNLLTNALTHGGSTHRIDVRPQQLEQEAQVEVQDYGPGIPVEDQPHIFTPFYRGGGMQAPPSRGLGLGLFICHELVVAHGGTIEVRSTPGEGSTFIIRLPLQRQEREGPD